MNEMLQYQLHLPKIALARQIGWVHIMADETPVAAAVRPAPPRRRNRRRQQSEGRRRRRFWQASDAHASGFAAADPAWPDQSLRGVWAPAPAGYVDGWTVTSEDRVKSLEDSFWTLDRCLSSWPHFNSASRLFTIKVKL